MLRRLLLAAGATLTGMHSGCGTDDGQSVSVIGPGPAGGQDSSGGASPAAGATQAGAGGAVAAGQAGTYAGSIQESSGASGAPGGQAGAAGGQAGGSAGAAGSSSEICCDADAQCPPGGVCVPWEPSTHCGDGACNETDLETCITCPEDCSCADGCHDGVCAQGESCVSCPADCGACSPSVCGDGVCDGFENCLNCPADCQCPPGVCRTRPSEAERAEGRCWLDQDCVGSADYCHLIRVCGCGEVGCTDAMGVCAHVEIGRPLWIEHRHTTAPLSRRGERSWA